MPKLKPGDEITIRVKVTAVWPSGEVTVHIKSAGQKVTLPNANDIVQEAEKK